MAVSGDTITKGQAALKVVPFVMIACAGIAVRTPLAQAYPVAALLIFLWVVSDTLMLTLIARSSTRPEWTAVLGTMAGASLTTWVVSPPFIRATLWTMPALPASMAVIVASHGIRGAIRAAHMLNGSERSPKDRWINAASEILPPALVRLAATELTLIHMALFRWGGPADVPANATAFSYHRHLTPICATLLILSVIEIAVYHLFVAHWNRTAALIMFVLSDVGFVYLVGLIKSFRFRPILLSPEGIHVRAGFLIDQIIPTDTIVRIETNFTGEQIRDPATLNAALLAWPNILILLRHPMPRQSLLKRKAHFSRVAFRLDNPASFIQLIESDLIGLNRNRL